MTNLSVDINADTENTQEAIQEEVNVSDKFELSKQQAKLLRDMKSTLEMQRADLINKRKQIEKAIEDHNCMVNALDKLFNFKG